MLKPSELLKEEPKQITKRKRQLKQVPTQSPQLPNQLPPLHVPNQSPTPTQVPNQSPRVPHQLSSSELEFTTFVHNSGLVFRVGSVYFLESVYVPFVISIIFCSNLQSAIMASCFRCILNSDKSKVIGFCKDFHCTVNLSYFVRVPNKGEFLFPFSKDIDNLVTVAQTRLVSCQLSNLGVVSYQRELRHHALGAQMCRLCLVVFS